MEKIQNRTKNVGILQGYTPYWGISPQQLKNKKWELVYFLYPYCDGTCAHCWSSETFLGRVMSVRWHQKFWKNVNPSRLKEIKLTGGEPFLYDSLGEVVKIIREYLGSEIPIKIFTGGRKIISLKENKKGIKETVSNLLKTGVIAENVEIHLSVDEHHAGSLYRANQGIKKRPRSLDDIQEMNQIGIPFLQTQAKNFLAACEILIKKTNGRFKGGKLKVHAELGRLKYHRKKIFHWIDDRTWESKVTCSEGVIKSGAAKKLEGTIDILPNHQLSLFIFPGAEFYQKPQTYKAQAYYNFENQRKVFLDLAREDGDGASIIGWWNIINRNFCGGSAKDALNLIIGHK